MYFFISFSNTGSLSLMAVVNISLLKAHRLRYRHFACRKCLNAIQCKSYVCTTLHGLFWSARRREDPLCKYNFKEAGRVTVVLMISQYSTIDMSMSRVIRNMLFTLYLQYLSMQWKCRCIVILLTSQLNTEGRKQWGFTSLSKA